MELNNEFRVGVPPAVAWSVLTDVERIAPCMPGAQLQEIEGDEFRGIVKVKVGPITAQYKGKATFLERDESGGRLVLRAEGRDTRGQGNANATITATLAPDGDGTSVNVLTDLTVTGKVAQFGRGVLAEVSAKLLNQFVACLERDVLAAGAQPGSPGGAARSGATEASAPPAPTAAVVAAEATGSAASAPEARGATVTDTAASARVPAGPNGASPEAVDRPTVRKVEHREAAPVDLIGAAGGSVIKRAAPALAAIALLLVFLGWRRRSRRR
jgi:carbon monoxide dehydrogenase subunit G